MLMRVEAAPDPIIEPFEPDPPAKSPRFPLWSIAHIDETALEALAYLFDESVYDFETRYLKLR